MKSALRKILFGLASFGAGTFAFAAGTDNSAGESGVSEADVPAYSFAALVKRPPFKTVAKSRAPAKGTVSQQAQLRFLGMITIAGKTEFGLYDSAAQRSFWLGLRESNGSGIFVESFDEPRKTLAVRVNAERRTLTLATPEEKPLAISGATYSAGQTATTQANSANASRGNAQQANRSSNERGNFQPPEMQRGNQQSSGNNRQRPQRVGNSNNGGRSR